MPFPDSVTAFVAMMPSKAAARVIQPCVGASILASELPEQVGQASQNGGIFGGTDSSDGNVIV